MRRLASVIAKHYLVIIVTTLLGCSVLGYVLGGFRFSLVKALTHTSEIQASEVQVTCIAAQLRPINKKVYVNGATSSLELELKNFYNKPITAFLMSGAGRVTVDFLGIGVTPDARRQIDPGGTYTVSLPLEGFPRITNVYLRAVIFKDKSIDGDYKDGNAILAFREGIKRQIGRISPLLNALEKAKDTKEEDDLLVSIESQVALFPTNEVVDESPYLGAGLQHAKEAILDEIRILERDDIKNNKKVFQDRIIMLKKHYDKHLEDL